MSNNQTYAVITGDLVGSSKMDQENRSLLLNTLKEAFERVDDKCGELNNPVLFDIFRGDSFQGVLSNPACALAASLVIRSSLRKAQPESSSVNWDARTAIGIGTIEYLPKAVSEGDGEAYRHSGPLLDTMKTDQRLLITTPWKDLDPELNTQSALLDAIIAKWSPQQAETVLKLIQGNSRKVIGQEFAISQAAVHYRVKGAGWSAIEKFLNRYQTVINERLKA